MSVLLGPAITTVLTFDSTTIGNSDTRTYMGLARFELKQNPKRKYRIIVPALAAAINSAAPIWNTIAPENYKEDFSLVFSFFIVNILLMSLFGMLIYRYLSSFNIPFFICLLGLLPMLTCKYTSICTGTPLAESLYLVVIAITLLGIRTRNNRLLILAIFLGPFAKEAFVFIAPLIFFFGSISKARQLLLFTLSGVLVFGFRYMFDAFAGLPPAQGIKVDIDHLNRATSVFISLFSFKTVLQFFFTTGIWIIFIVIASSIKTYRQKIKELSSPFHICFLITVFVQILLSGSVDRMLYLAIPLFCLIVAFSFRYIFEFFERKSSPTENVNF